jgi:hypothetical protein
VFGETGSVGRAAGVLADERHTQVRTGGDHGGVEAEPGGASVRAPVGWVSLDLPAPSPPALLGQRVGSGGTGTDDQHPRTGSPRVRESGAHGVGIGPRARAGDQHAPGLIVAASKVDRLGRASARAVGDPATLAQGQGAGRDQLDDRVVLVTGDLLDRGRVGVVTAEDAVGGPIRT